MTKPTYRVLVSYDAERSLFVAHAPELPHCAAEGPSRAAALTAVEEEIEAQLDNARQRGGHLPPPLDEQSHSGELAARISKSLHRELAFQARSEGIELNQLLAELLAAGLEARSRSRGRPAPRREEGPAPDGGERDRPRGRGPQGNRYHNLMEDRANFIEYVRGLESGGRPGEPRRPSGPPPAGRRRGPGGGRGGDDPNG